jgi:Zn-dependent peptidase ImmA (M78 family)
MTWKQEREADECAAHILMPQEELRKLVSTFHLFVQLGDILNTGLAR